MDAETLRRLVLTQAWCEKCGLQGHSHGNVCDATIHPPLWLRPGGKDARPAGLGWSELTDGWGLRDHIGGAQGSIVRGCKPERAAALIGWAEATLLAEAIQDLRPFAVVADGLAAQGKVSVVDWRAVARDRICQLMYALAADTPLEKVRALIELHHKLLDSREDDDG